MANTAKSQDPEERGGDTPRLSPCLFVLIAAQLATLVLVAAVVLWPSTWLRVLTVTSGIGAVVAAAVVFASAWRQRVSADGLRQEIVDLAYRRLPEALRGVRDGHEAAALARQLRVPSDEQVKPLADAFESISGQVLRLAAEQEQIRSGYSEVFVNMFRRSQSLMQRQLQIIEQLEQGDRSPEDLNRLFQLDHLVTRMRRNNENILVLSGTELIRKSRKPVSISDVIRAAISEIDSYQRVKVLETPAVKISNSAAGDLIRIVAELLDNATSFSAPGELVTVQAELGRHRGLSISVVDNGIGMSDDDIRKVNEQLTRLGSAEIARSRRVGLLVAGRLAGRHGFKIELFGGGAVDGVSALISVPSEALVEEHQVRSALHRDPTRGASAGPAQQLVAVPEPAPASSRPRTDTMTVRRPDFAAELPDLRKPRQISSWHTRPKTNRPATRNPARNRADLVKQAHADVPAELPIRVPNRPARTRDPAQRSSSQWFTARQTASEPREASPPPGASGERRETPAENWQSTADPGWHIVATVTSSDGYTYTEDGLPLRKQGAHLLPGSAGRPADPASTDVANPSERDPVRTRSRLSSYQQGVQKAKQQEATMRGTKHSGGWTVLERHAE
ncbi:ATP-binding protein [Amycolatopsis sp. NPDC058986]|uniref:ATP-binding protein n=1 Tax=unclassified Amycolatopsis TaxID=2618356 RepID=UPI00366FD015